MKKTERSIIVLAMCILASTSFATNRADITRRYLEWDRYYKGHDVSALGRILSPTFQLLTGSGKTISRSDYVASLGKSMPPTNYHTKLLHMKRKGSRVEAFTEEVSGQHIHHYNDKWERVKGKWLLVSSKTLDEN